MMQHIHENQNDQDETVMNRFVSMSPNFQQKKSVVSFANTAAVKTYENQDINISLEEMIDDDEKFFNHLQKLKKENERNLVRLKRLYEKERSMSQKTSSLNRDDVESVVSRSYINAIEAVSQSYDDSSSSSEELDEQLKVNVPENHINILPNNEQLFRGRESSYDVISQMWENFSVADYAPYRKQKNKVKSWSPSITIPQPFSMTVREEKAHNLKSKRLKQIEKEKLEKKLAEEAELQKKIAPVPIPPSTFLPLYEELEKQQKLKREYLKSIYIEMLKTSEKPFSFVKREEIKKRLKKMQTVKSRSEKKEIFKANPFPEKLFENTLAGKRAEEEFYRKIKMKLRSQEMMISSSLPPNMKMYEERKAKKSRSVRDDHCTFTPQIHDNIPNFHELQMKFQKELEYRKQEVTPTVCQPFKLKTAAVPIRRSEFEKSIQINKHMDKRTGQPLPKSDKKRTSTNSRVRKSFSSPCLERDETSKCQDSSPSYRLTESARLRESYVRNSISKQEEKSRSKDDQRGHKKFLKNVVSNKSKVNDVSLNRKTKMDEKIQNFKNMEASRKKDYRTYLRSVNERLKERPLLFEQVSLANAKMKAQRKYEEILQNAGLNEEIVHSIIQDSVYDVTNEKDLCDDVSYSPPTSIDDDNNDDDTEQSNGSDFSGDDDSNPFVDDSHDKYDIDNHENDAEL